MREIKLTNSDLVALVDDSDFMELSKFKWHLDRGYAARTISGVGIVYMHRQVNGTPKGLSTDHINRDKLDNRKRNLRTCNQSQNSGNSSVRKNRSGFKGVVWHKKDKRWQAQIGVNGKCRYLGQFINKNDAARAYNKAAKSFFGEFANLNEVV